MPEQITLYVAKICPFSHRVELALAEVKAGFSRFEVDLVNKPEWYAPQVNPASKVPAIAYGGPQVSPDQPSPESVKITESLILVELVADLYPDSPILPKDPIQRAKARFFIDAVSTKFLPSWLGPLVRGQSFEPFFDALAILQDLLSPSSTFAISDEYTVADIAITPFLARMEVALKNDIGAYKEGEGKKAYDVIFSSERFARIAKYFNTIKARESFAATFDGDYIKDKYRLRFGEVRKQLQAAPVAAAA
ncbi:glutathione S-transferase [Mycena rebaudengoi]|nr:glutathione S-transferase [Mycena rebaudengoi]